MEENRYLQIFSSPSELDSNIKRIIMTKLMKNTYTERSMVK